MADFKVWFVGLRDPLPTIDIPLHDDGSGIAVDLQAILAQTYQRGGLGYVVRYDDPAVLGLAPRWARACVAQWQTTQAGSST